MSNDKYTEDSYKQTLIQLFSDKLGYEYECGYDVDRVHSGTDPIV